MCVAGSQDQPQLGTPTQAEAASYKRSQGFTSPEAAPEDQGAAIKHLAGSDELFIDGLGNFGFIAQRSCKLQAALSVHIGLA